MFLFVCLFWVRASPVWLSLATALAPAWGLAVAWLAPAPGHLARALGLFPSDPAWLGSAWHCLPAPGLFWLACLAWLECWLAGVSSWVAGMLWRLGATAVGEQAACRNLGGARDQTLAERAGEQVGSQPCRRNPSRQIAYA